MRSVRFSAVVGGRGRSPATRWTTSAAAGTGCPRFRSSRRTGSARSRRTTPVSAADCHARTAAVAPAETWTPAASPTPTTAAAAPTTMQSGPMSAPTTLWTRWGRRRGSATASRMRRWAAGREAADPATGTRRQDRSPATVQAVSGWRQRGPAAAETQTGPSVWRRPGATPRAVTTTEAATDATRGPGRPVPHPVAPGSALEQREQYGRQREGRHRQDRAVLVAVATAPAAVVDPVVAQTASAPMAVAAPTLAVVVTAGRVVVAAVTIVVQLVAVVPAVDLPDVSAAEPAAAAAGTAISTADQPAGRIRVAAAAASCSLWMLAWTAGQAWTTPLQTTPRWNPSWGRKCPRSGAGREPRRRSVSVSGCRRGRCVGRRIRAGLVVSDRPACTVPEPGTGSAPLAVVPMRSDR